MRYNQKIKHYQHGKKIITWNYPIYNPEKDLTKKKQRKSYKKTNNLTRNDSIKRAKEKVFDIAYSNEFQYFITFTVADKYLRYSADELLKKIKIWLSNKVQRNDMNYLMIPEYHKDGAIHFHALVNGNFNLIDSGKKVRKGHSKGKTIYNLDNWKYGWTTAINIDGDKVAISKYITKYITKDIHKIFGKMYLAGGKNLNRDIPCSYNLKRYFEQAGNEFEILGTTLKVKYTDLFNDSDLCLQGSESWEVI